MFTKRSRVKKKVMSLGIAVLLLISLTLPAAAANLGYVFSFSHSNYWYPTQNVPERILPYMWSMGYDAGEYTNNSVASAYNVLPNSKAFVFIGDGAPGILAFMNSSGSYSYLYGNSSNPGTNHRSISNLASNSLNGVRTVIFMATFTGRDNTNYGNLVDMAVAKGAQTAIGWKSSVDPTDGGADWLEAFFMYCNEGDTIQVAAISADNDMYGELDSTQYAEVRDRYVGGSLNTYLKLN